jgi:hypothetical protein
MDMAIEASDVTIIKTIRGAADLLTAAEAVCLARHAL